MEKVGEIESIRWYREKGEAEGLLTSKSVKNFKIGMTLTLSQSQRVNRLNQVEASTKVLKFNANTREITLSFDTSDIQKIQNLRSLYYPIDPHENEYIFDPGLYQFIKRSVFQKSQLLSSISPFVKKEGNSFDNSTLRVASRRDLTADEKLKDIRTILTGAHVVLSHSNKVSEKETLCHARIQSVDICSSRVVITISNEESIDIWEDLDVWIYPFEFYQTEDELDDVDLKTAVELETNDVFSKVTRGWKYVRGEFKRFRVNEDGEWKNEYSTILQMKPVDESEYEFLKFIEKGSRLRLSLENDVPGPIFVRINRVAGDSANLHEDERNTIYVAIVAFESTSTKVLLSKEVPYYLALDRRPEQPVENYEEFSENTSQSSKSTEDGVLEGYSLVENVDELCEIIGELRLIESDINSFIDINGNQTSHVRLAFASENTKFPKRFLCLEGRFVKLTSLNDESISILALVTRVMNDLIILTLEGVPEIYTRFEISKRFGYEIRVDHRFERFVVKKRPKCRQIDIWLRIQEEMKGNDLRSDRDWIEVDRKSSKKRYFCTFTSKRRCYDLINDGDLVLLSQCWIVTGVVDRKTNFVYGIKRNKTDRYTQSDPKKVCFEITLDENNTNMTSFPRAYYFLSTECSMLFENGCGWQRFIVVNTKKERIYRRNMIESNDMFDIVNWNIEFLENEDHKNEVESLSLHNFTNCSLDSPNDSSSINEYKTDETQSSTIFDYDLMRNARTESLRLEKLNLKEIGFVNIIYIAFWPHLGNRIVLLIDASDEKCDIEEVNSVFEIGQRLFLTLDHMSENVNIVGDILRQQSETLFLVSVDPTLSNRLFLPNWIQYMYSFKIPSMKMLCHVQK